ncbi:DJ-1/PfpI family protein [Haloarchaeobius sp. HME9146]|uniref:DJ-1/PfpI family protein n=1 Tax=Haloarchaeobius sp. HME9146 TaxID=2978732 RepID=UPI0021C07B28|nr:DJ-1/PfpI family protein [Haloarchaeobius sp. HME9146]MCT9095592.1 DJ-1/PfpI family protein [Haloarchaeobius sp. HME9146]
MRVAILLYDGFDELDAIGPFEVFQTAGALGGEMEASLRTVDPVSTVTASHGLTVAPDGKLDEYEADLVLVPGGGWNTDPDEPGARREFEAGTIPDALAERHEETTIASVCTGAMLLAAAGLLNNRPATTHHSAKEDLGVFANVKDDRIVDDGDVLTAGGVTSGLDLAFYLVRMHCEDGIGEAVADEMEYQPRV